MNLAEFAKKLRATADQIESLLTVDVFIPSHGNGIERPVDITGWTANDVVQRLPKPPRKYRRKSLHWTQRPENKAKLRKVVRKMQAAK